MKLYINHKLEICANEKGWPKEMCPADAKEADFERKRYAYELAKAKQESVPVITNYAGEMMDRIGSREFKPDTFIEFAGEVGYGWQWRPYDTSEWQATNEYYATIVRCGGNPCAQVRKVARLKPAKEPIPGHEQGEPGATGEARDATRREPKPIRPPSSETRSARGRREAGEGAGGGE